MQRGSHDSSSVDAPVVSSFGFGHTDAATPTIFDAQAWLAVFQAIICGDACCTYPMPQSAPHRCVRMFGAASASGRLGRCPTALAGDARTSPSKPQFLFRAAAPRDQQPRLLGRIKSPLIRKRPKAWTDKIFTAVEWCAGTRSRAGNGPMPHLPIALGPLPALFQAWNRSPSTSLRPSDFLERQLS